MQLNKNIKKFAVIGHPIGHSLSPIMHNASMKSLGYNGIYSALDVPPDDLINTLYSMRDSDFIGVNLTVPHKEVAYHQLDLLDDSAKLFKSVNTVHFSDKGLMGYNTDGVGFLKALEESFGLIQNKNVFVLGCGGAGRTVALQMAINGIERICLADVNNEKLIKLSNELKNISSKIEINYTNISSEKIDLCKSCDLVVQASPIGMKLSDEALLPVEAFHKNQKVFDLIYMYPETQFLKTAKMSGAEIANGLGMLLHQGSRSFTIWTDQDPDIKAMRKSLEEVVYGNIR